MDPFTIGMPEVVTQVRDREVSLRELVITEGDTETPASVSLWLHPKLDDGRWDPAVPGVKVNITGAGPDAEAGSSASPSAKVPVPAGLASDLREVILDAVATGPLAAAYGIEGMPIRLAGRQILTGLGVV